MLEAQGTPPRASQDRPQSGGAGGHSPAASPDDALCSAATAARATPSAAPGPASAPQPAPASEVQAAYAAAASEPPSGALVPEVYAAIKLLQDTFRIPDAAPAAAERATRQLSGTPHQRDITAHAADPEMAARSKQQTNGGNPAAPERAVNLMHRRPHSSGAAPAACERTDAQEPPQARRGAAAAPAAGVDNAIATGQACHVAEASRVKPERHAPTPRRRAAPPDAAGTDERRGLSDSAVPMFVVDLT